MKLQICIKESFENAKKERSLFDARIEGEWPLKILRAVLPTSQRKKGEMHSSQVENSQIVAMKSKIQTHISRNAFQAEIWKPSDKSLFTSTEIFELYLSNSKQNCKS
jgi:hypothetical protein